MLGQDPQWERDKNVYIWHVAGHTGCAQSFNTGAICDAHEQSVGSTAARELLDTCFLIVLVFGCTLALA
jgi:hypothetical protein